MSKTVIGALVVAGVGFLLAVLFVGSVISQNNDWVKMEANLQAKYEDNQNSYDSFFKKVLETAQVPRQYAQDVERAYKTTMQATFGSEGSKAAFQVINQINPQMDASMYKQVQQVIEAGRNDFKTDQTVILDMRKNYISSLGTFPNNMYAKFLGFPKVDLNKYNIVSSDETQQAFETKKAKTLDVFNTQKQ